MLDVLAHRQRRRLRVAVEEDGRPRHARDSRLTDPQDLDELAQRSLLPFAVPAHDLTALVPGRKHGVDADRDDDRQPTARKELDQVRAEEPEVDNPKQRTYQHDLPDVPPPPDPRRSSMLDVSS